MKNPETYKSIISFLFGFLPGITLFGILKLNDAIAYEDPVSVLILIAGILVSYIGLPIGLLFSCGGAMFAFRSIRDGSEGFEKVINYIVIILSVCWTLGFGAVIFYNTAF